MALLSSLVLQAKKKEDGRDKAVTVTLNQQPLKNDNISLYYMPERADLRVDCYRMAEGKDPKMNLAVLWHRLLRIYNVKDMKKKVITIPTKGGPSTPPLLRTRSALGILKNAGEQDGYQLIKIESTQDIRDIIAAHEARIRTFNDCTDEFYTKDETWLDQRKAFMLIARSDTPQSDAFVSVSEAGNYYSILSEDKLSQRTLALISQFDTILAVPSQGAPLTPTISVGARM